MYSILGASDLTRLVKIAGFCETDDESKKLTTRVQASLNNQIDQQS